MDLTEEPIPIETIGEIHLVEIQCLPQEILDHIVYLLSPIDACNLMATSKIMNDRLWKRIYTLDLQDDNFLLWWACAEDFSVLVNRLTTIPGIINRSYDTWDVDQPETPLQVAAHHSHAGIVARLLACGADVDGKDKTGRTALSYVRTVDVTEALLDAGADANETDDHGWTALLHILNNLSKGSPATAEVVKVLLEKGNAQTDFTGPATTALSLATQKHDVSIVKLLLTHGADPNFKPDPNDLRTPLAQAASREDGVEIVALLLKHGAPIYARETLSSALVEAIAAHAIESIKLLLAEGADVNLSGVTLSSLSDVMYSQWGADYHTPLEAAISTGSLEITKLVVSAGADVGEESDITSMSSKPLLHAARQLSFDIVEFLLDCGANCDNSLPYAFAVRGYLNWRYDKLDLSDGAILLVQENCYRILDLLADRGVACLEQPASRFHDEPMVIAFDAYGQDLLRKVVSHGANVNIQWVTGNFATLLHEGLHRGILTPKTISVLLDHGANLRLGRRLRDTPLAIMILKSKAFMWGDHQWARAQCVLKHECGGPTITAKYSAGMMAIFLSQAVVSADVFDLSERIVEFAKLTNTRGQWGPDGISGLRELTHRPEYWREPWLRDGGNPAARGKLQMASRLMDKLCPGRGKAGWFLWDLQPKTTARPKSESMLDEDLKSAFDLLFLN